MKKKSFISTPLAFYQHIWGKILKTLLLIFFWWFITGLFDNKWAGLWTNIRKCPSIIWESLPFLIIFSLVTLVWQGFASVYFSRISTQNNIIYRPSFWGYLKYDVIIKRYYLAIILFYFSWQYGILRKTMLAVLVYVLVMTVSGFSEATNIKKNVSDLLKKSTNIVSYLSTMDFPTRTSDFKFINPIKFKYFESNDTALFITNVGSCHLLPYWISAQIPLLRDTVNDNLLLVIDLNFGQLSEKQIHTILDIVDTYLKQKKRVLAIQKMFFSSASGLSNMEQKSIASMDHLLLSELRKRHIQLLFDNANDSKLLRDYIANPSVPLSKFPLLSTINEQLSQLSQATCKAEYKYEFINSVVSGLQIDADMTDNFYNAMRMAEFIFHYRALCELVENPSKQTILPDSLISTMGFWMNIQSSGKKKYDGQTVIAYKNIYQLLKSKPFNKEKVNYSEICSLLTELRNRYIGHGTMAFSVSEEMFSWVLELILVITQVFEQDSRVLTMESVIFDHLAVFAGTLENMEPQSGLLFAYSEKGKSNFEYLDYHQGSVFAKETKHYQLDYMGE